MDLTSITAGQERRIDDLDVGGMEGNRILGAVMVLLFMGGLEIPIGEGF